MFHISENRQTNGHIFSVIVETIKLKVFIIPMVFMGFKSHQRPPFWLDMGLEDWLKNLHKLSKAITIIDK